MRFRNDFILIFPQEGHVDLGIIVFPSANLVVASIHEE
jgi:hypothetical protein